jgi:uncharacterized cupredoxin-like copper-binding protein
MHLPSRPRVRSRPAVSVARIGLAVLAVVAPMALAACDAAAPGATPQITPGTSARPREVNIVARDYAYVPSVVDLHPGETVVFHVINGGLVVHEAILGDMDAQLAWENAEAPYVDAPPGPTPLVPAPSGFEGTRIVVNSGQRLDVTWTVPDDAAQAASGWFVGCHIPGHWQKGMVVPVRFVDDAGKPIGSVQPGASLPPTRWTSPSAP